MDVGKIRRTVDESIMERERGKEVELKWAEQQRDPTAMRRALSATAEAGITELIQDEKRRKAAKARGRRRVADYKQVPTHQRGTDLRESPNKEVIIPTQTHAALVTAERMIKRLEFI